MRKEILLIETLADFENRINRDKRHYDVNMMVMPGTLQDKHKDVDPEKGIQALRRKFNLIYLLQSGEHDVHLGADYGRLKPNDLVIVPENFLYASTHIRGCTGYCIHFKTEFLQRLNPAPLSDTFPYFDWNAAHIINLSNEESGEVSDCFKRIIEAYYSSSSEKEELVRSYLYILLLKVRELYPTHAKQLQEKASRASKITGKFRQLVEKHFVECREVQQYAAMLHIAPKYLAEAVKETTGCSPKEIINSMLLLESKLQLGATDKSITEIAHELHFLDQAHFSHFIKQHAGCSPLQLRKKL